MKRLFGLIGFPLSHSFSKKYFTEKFAKEGIDNASYELFEMKDAADFVTLFENNSELKGINVTIPHKQAVIPLLNRMDVAAKAIGAVNVIKKEGADLVGYNSDYYGFKWSLEKLVGDFTNKKAIVLGTGGAAKAVWVALEDLKVPYIKVSRNKSDGVLAYSDLNEGIIAEHQIIINTTPLGMYPKVDACPDIPYAAIGENHFLFDLVYNPEVTLFMQKGMDRNAKAINGLEMLVGQAEKAWEIWNV